MLIDPEILRASLLTPTAASDGTFQWGLRLAYEGPPGIGKTAIVQSVAKELGLDVHILRAASMDPTDVLGIPTPIEVTLPSVGGAPPEKVVTTAPAIPQWAIETRLRPTLVFCDEFTAGSGDAVMAALLEVVQDYKVGRFRLGPHTRMVGAYNPSECAAGGTEIPAPMANRLVHMRVMLDAGGQVKLTQQDKDTWVDYFSTANDDLSATSVELDPSVLHKEEKKVLAVWSNAYSDARQLMIGFVLKSGSAGKVRHANKEINLDPFYALPDPEDPRVNHGWNSPRSIETAARIVATSKIHGLSASQEQTMLNGAVGEPWAKKFTAWRRHMDLPSGEEFIAKGGWKRWKFDDRADRTYTVLTTAAGYVCSQNTRAKQREPLKELVACLKKVAEDQGVDHIVQPFRMLDAAGLARNAKEELDLPPEEQCSNITMSLTEIPRLTAFMRGLKTINRASK